MGRELQKKKNRSSLPKIRQKQKRNPQKVAVGGNAIIASKWKRTETLTQNYRRLGLAARLNGVTGGVEKKVGDVVEPNKDNSHKHGHGREHSLAINNINSARTTEEVRVERDQHGVIVKVIRFEEDEKKKKKNPLGDPLNDLEEEDEDEDDENRRMMMMMGTDRGVVRELERLAAAQTASTTPRVRRQSGREEEWIRRLVERYGDNYRGMFWDRKLNPLQQSEGDIRRRVERWKEKGEGTR